VALGTPYLVCNGQHGSGSATLQVPVTTDTVLGDAISVAVAVNSSDTFVSVTDSKGNAYVQALAPVANGAVSQVVYVALNAAKLTVAASDWIKLIVGTTSSAKTLAAVGCSGVAVTGAVDQAVSATGNSASPAVTSGTLAQAAELCIASITTAFDGSNVSPWGNSFNGISAQHAPTSEYNSVAWKIVAATTAVTANGTITATTWSDILVTLKAQAIAAAPGGPAPVPQPGSARWRALFRRTQQVLQPILPLPPPPPPVFPGAPLPITVELLLNGTWTDISGFCQQRAPIVITRGRADEAQAASPATMSLTLSNRGGDFSPRNTAGQFFPFIGRNTQIRVSVTASSASGAVYSGYRFWGEVSSWPPRWDYSGEDVYVPVVAAGILRRFAQGASIGSALRRFYTLKNDATTPVSYWPCEEQAAATQFANVVSPGDDMVFTGTPGIASDSSFLGSDPIPLISKSTWTGNTGSFSTSGDDVFTTPGTHQWVAPFTGTADARAWAAGGGGEVLQAGAGGSGGGGGEFAEEPALAFTAGQAYTVVVGAAGSAGKAGGQSSVQGDAVLVLAHGGGFGGAHVGGAGGTGSTNSVRHNGGAGGAAAANFGGGHGGGGSGGTAAAGNAGGVANSNSGAPGAAAVTDGGPGGAGGNSGAAGRAPAAGPGGGGGGGGNGAKGANGYAGKAEIISTPVSAPNTVVVRHLLDIPAAGTVSGATISRTVIASGTLSKIELYYGTGGKLGFRGFDTIPSSKFDSGVQSFSAAGRQLMVSMELAKSGSNVAWKLTAIVPGAGTVVATFTGSFAGTIGAASQVIVNPAGNIDDVGLGHVVVQYALEDLTVVSSSLNGHAGELAADRFIRLCTEQGIASALTGSGGDTPLMGPQLDAKLTDLLQEIEDADRGQLSEPRDFFGLRYRTRVSMQNQAPDLALDYAQRQLSGALEPAVDDSLTRNDVTVSRPGGASVQIALESGALSVLDPPAGVGSYTFALTANVSADGQLSPLAQWILSLGTVDEYRYPVITLNLASPGVAALFASVPVADAGDFVQIANPPAWLPAGPVEQLALGFTETLGAYEWIIDFNLVPESPYEGIGLPAW